MLLALLLSAATLADAETAFKAKDYAKAAAVLEQVVAAEPQNGPAWFRLGTALHMQGRFAPALEAYEKARTAGYRSLALGWNRACANARLGHKDEAMKILTTLVESSAGAVNPKDLESDDDLASLQREPAFKKLVARADDLSHPCETAAHRQLDFWLGEFNVTDPSGQHLGDSKISRILNGCVLLEEWSSTRGQTGKSFNVYDPAKKAWRQTWVDSSGSQTDYAGRFEDGSLVYLADEGKQRMTFTPRSDKTVRQHMEQKDDQGRYSTTFDGIYTPTKEKRGGTATDHK